MNIIQYSFIEIKHWVSIGLKMKYLNDLLKKSIDSIIIMCIL